MKFSVDKECTPPSDDLFKPQCHEGKNTQLPMQIRLGIWLEGLQKTMSCTGLSACGQCYYQWNSREFKCNQLQHWISQAFTLEAATYFWVHYLPSKTWFRIRQALSATSGECGCFLIISKTFICMPLAKSVFLIFTTTQNSKHPISKPLSRYTSQKQQNF